MRMARLARAHGARDIAVKIEHLHLFGLRTPRTPAHRPGLARDPVEGGDDQHEHGVAPGLGERAVKGEIKLHDLVGALDRRLHPRDERVEARAEGPLVRVALQEAEAALQSVAAPSGTQDPLADRAGVGRPPVRRPLNRIALTAALLAGLGAAALAADGGVRVELNRLEPRGDACRAHLLLESATTRAFESLRLELVLFDEDGVVTRRVAVETAPLPAGKTSLEAFDIDGLACAAVGRVLLNDVLACADAEGPVRDCLSRLEVAAREGLVFIK